MHPQYEEFTSLRNKLLKHELSHRNISLARAAFRVIPEIFTQQTSLLTLLLKSIRYSFFITTDKKFTYALAKASGEQVSIQTWHRPRQSEMWHHYLKTLALKESDHVLYQEHNLIPQNPFKLFSQVSLKKEFINILSQHKSIHLIERMWLWAYLTYVCNTIDYLVPIISKKSTPCSLYIDGDAHLPGAIMTEYYNNQGCTTFSLPFFALTDSADLKVPMAVTWINMNVRKALVWGSAYKHFLNEVRPDITISYIAHPDHQRKNSYAFAPDTTQFVIAPNPHDCDQSYNHDLIKVFDAYSQKHSCNVHVKLHPVDSEEWAQNLFATKKWMRGYTEELNQEVIYIIGESTLYFDLIAQGKTVLRYKHPKGFQRLYHEQADSFVNADELYALVSSMTKTQRIAIYNSIMKNYFNLI